MIDTTITVPKSLFDSNTEYIISKPCNFHCLKKKYNPEIRVSCFLKDLEKSLEKKPVKPELMKKQGIIHEILTYYLSYKGIYVKVKVVLLAFFLVRIKHFDLRDFSTSFSMHLYVLIRVLRGLRSSAGPRLILLTRRGLVRVGPKKKVSYDPFK